MNYANMIEEKGLKKGFIVATLVSTIIGTFTTSLNFYDRVQEKKANKRQQGVDDGQNKQIQDLKAQVEKMESQKGSKKESRSRSRSSSRRRRRRRSVGYDDEQDFRRMADRSRAMIEREYDNNYLRLGQRYAQGDIVTENKLQAQIITLQQAVINVLQEALMDGRTLSKADIHRLIAAQDLAREGSLDALRGQYDRLLPDSLASKQLRIEAPPNNTSLQRQRTLPMPEHEHFPPPKRVQSMPVHSAAEHLYCRYSLELQDARGRVSPPQGFSSSDSCRCPSCGVRLPVSSLDVWTFDVRTPIGDDIVERRKYEMDARLVIKSHTARGDYACVICARERDLDCVCRSVEGLVEHLGRVHTSVEFERESDMHRV